MALYPCCIPLRLQAKAWRILDYRSSDLSSHFLSPQRGCKLIRPQTNQWVPEKQGCPVTWRSCPPRLPWQHPQTHEFYFTLYYYRHVSSSVILSIAAFSFHFNIISSFAFCAFRHDGCILFFLKTWQPLFNPELHPISIHCDSCTIRVLLPVLCHCCLLFFPYFSPKLSPFPLNCDSFLHFLYPFPLTQISTGFFSFHSSPN